jgi:hypothetical protein
MNRLLTTIFLSALAIFSATGPAQAGRFSHCECVGDYTPPRGAVKMFTARVKTEWEHRFQCLPCGRKLPYKVKVITYRDRYTDGTARTWKCVVASSEVSLGK